MRLRPTVLAATCLLAVALAACGTASKGGSGSGSGTGNGTTANKDVGLVPPASLVTEAKKEGVLSIQSTAPQTDLQQLAKDFEATYGITVEFKKESSGPIYQLVEQQVAAHNVQLDAIGITPDPTFLSKYSGAFVKLSATKIPNLAKLPAYQKTSIFEAAYYQYYGWIYNSSILKASQLPGTLTGLATDPALKGKIATADVNSALSFIQWWAMEYKNLGKTKWTNFVDGLFANQHVQATGQGSAQLDEVASGSIAIDGPISIGQASTLLQSGAPLAIKYYNPIMEGPSGYMVLKNAPHPAAALLWMNYLLGPQAQKILTGDNQAVSYLKVPGSVQKPPGAQIVQIPLDPASVALGQSTILPYFQKKGVTS